MAGWISPADAKARLVLVDEALAFHVEQGTSDGDMARRLTALRGEYAAVAARGNLSLGETPNDREFTGRSSAARQVGSKTGNTTKSSASEKSRSYAMNLWERRDCSRLAATNKLLYSAAKRMAEGGPIDQRTCSDFISIAKDLPWRPRTEALAAPKRTQVATPAVAPLEAGYYYLTDEAEVTSFYKVKISKTSGRPYAELWDGYSWDYEAGKGKVRLLTADNVLDAEGAKMFGDAFHSCIFCHQDLTDQRSIDAGYGPKCASKHSLPWG